MKPLTILISRSDSIGDVLLTLPLTGFLKQMLPECRIIFLGREYTKPVVECCSHVDAFILKEDFLKMTTAEDFGINFPDVILHVFPNREIARKARELQIPVRIGTSHRLYHWLTCNRLPNLGRKNSDLHESVLNIRLSESLGLSATTSEENLYRYYGFSAPGAELPVNLSERDGRKRIIIHPKSQGSAREYPQENFARLINLLPEEEYRIFISGTESEGNQLAQLRSGLHRPVDDLTGKLTLKEFIQFISTCDVLCAASTGPLHIAAALGKHALGLYVPLRPVHPGRWKPIGEHCKVFVTDRNCSNCVNPIRCECIRSIQPDEIAAYIRHLRFS